MTAFVSARFPYTVKKKDDSLCFCADVEALNDWLD